MTHFLLMPLKTNCKIYIFILFQLLVKLINSSYSYAQPGTDVRTFKIVGLVQSITNLKGWSKYDIGKWYEFNTAFNFIETRGLSVL